MKKLLDYCSVSGSSVKNFSNEKKYIATGDVINNKVVSFENVTYENKPSRANQLAETDEILFAKMKDTLKVLLIDDELSENIYSTGFFVIKANKDVVPKYLYWLFNSSKFNQDKDKNSKGATQQAINLEGLNKILIKDIPNLEEQKKIIDKIEKAFEIIELKKKQLQDLDELIKSQFVEMFGTDKKSKYIFDSLNNLTLKITDGKHGGCNGEDNSGYYFVGATEIYNDKINYQTAKEITKNDFEKDYKRCDLKNNDFVIVNTGATIGKSAIVNSNLTDHTLLQKSVALIRTKDDVLNPLYLKYCYEANPDLYNKGNGCARINLLLSQIKETMIPVPPIELQNKFAKIVEQIDKQKFEIQKSLEEMQNLQESLMNKYFG